MCDVHVPTQIPPLIQVDAETHFDPLVPKSHVVPAKSNVHATACSDSVEQRRTAALVLRQKILAGIQADKEERRSKRNLVSVSCAPITESQTEQQQQQQEQQKEHVDNQHETVVVVSSSSSRESSPQPIIAHDGNRRRSLRTTARMQCSNKAAPAKAAPAKAAPAKKEKSSSDSDSDSSSSSSCAPKKATKKGRESSSSGSSSGGSGSGSGSGSSSGSSDSSDSPNGVSTLSVPRRGFILGTSFDARTVEEAKSWLLTNFARAHGGHVFCRNSWWESLDVCFIRLTLVLQQ
jgi:hypothetical protein